MLLFSTEVKTKKEKGGIKKKIESLNKIGKLFLKWTLFCQNFRKLKKFL